MRLELEQAGYPKVRVTTVCPTYINTGMFDGAKAMLAGRPFVVMPWTSRMNKVLTGVLPVRLRDLYLRRVGVYNSMDEFTGH